MAKISDTEIEHLASLAKIALLKEEKAEIRTQIEAILDYVEKLKAINTKGVKPTNQVTGLENVLREDKPSNYGVKPKDILAGAPQTKDGYIKVKRVL